MPAHVPPDHEQLFWVAQVAELSRDAHGVMVPVQVPVDQVQPSELHCVWVNVLHALGAVPEHVPTVVELPAHVQPACTQYV